MFEVAVITLISTAVQQTITRKLHKSTIETTSHGLVCTTQGPSTGSSPRMCYIQHSRQVSRE